MGDGRDEGCRLGLGAPTGLPRAKSDEDEQWVGQVRRPEIAGRDQDVMPVREVEQPLPKPRTSRQPLEGAGLGPPRVAFAVDEGQALLERAAVEDLGGHAQDPKAGFVDVEDGSVRAERGEQAVGQVLGHRVGVLWVHGEKAALDTLLGP